jgi:hypothetical protein
VANASIAAAVNAALYASADALRASSNSRLAR